MKPVSDQFFITVMCDIGQLAHAAVVHIVYLAL